MGRRPACGKDDADRRQAGWSARGPKESNEAAYAQPPRSPAERLPLRGSREESIIELSGPNAEWETAAEQAPILFDRKLLRARRARFAHEIEARKFLLAHVAREIAERVEIMLRPSRCALDLGAYRGLLGLKSRRPQIGRRDDLRRERAACRALPAASTRLRRGLAALQGASLNLVVSGLALHRVNDLPGALIQIRRALRPDGLFMAAVLGARRSSSCARR